MSKDSFPFTPSSLRSLRLEQELQEWEDARRALAHRRAMTRAPLPRAPRPPPRQQRLQEVRAPPPQVRCRDAAVHNTFMCGDMKGVYAVLKDPAMVNALMETVHEDMVWAPEMGMWTLSSKVKQTSALRLAASRGHSGCVEELLFRGAEVNADPGGSTALHDACVSGHAVCAQLLLSHGADPELLAADGSAPLHLSCSSAQSFQCAELLIDGGAEVSVRMRESRLTPLHLAARRGLEEHVELLLSHGADVLATNQEGETPLNAACSSAERPSEAGRYLRVVQKLLAEGADPRTAGRKQHTPLHNACANSSPRIVDVLLRHGAKADVANCAGYTPMDCLLQAVEDYPGHQPEAIARSLLNHGVQPVSPKMLKQCVLSPATLEVMLNSYTSIPHCEWMDSLSTEIYEHRSFFDLMRQRSGQPRSLQHLCRCALRLRLGARCFPAVSELDIPSSVRDYLLLCNDGTLQ
ncbi:ankyrin repeat and SOCS box protein 16 isoform X2 [Cottoperca gobio]|uniref:Ankyrin repeat and SOCS box protein 16 isoform X2 n=1 Tax=Cottoperca gobio TaxID=56716 RepID=A0A6J2QAE1_COTGO|nr:ankyrin repeat and SOCS box protein 16 isoform X2 [Cottoperca gobio]